MLGGNRERRARGLLALGATAGLVLAAASLLGGSRQGAELPPGAVARVNGTLIRTEAYQRLLAALASDRRSPLTEADRQRVLDRLIEEELLVQHAVELGLVKTDRRVRADLVTAVLASLNASADAYEPDEAEVAAFYAENRDYFARPGRLHVRRVFVAARPEEDAGAVLARARAVSARLGAGEDFEAVRAELGDEPVAPLPDAPLPAAKLREYLGPSALEAALALGPGQVSEPVETPQGLHVLVLQRRSEAEAPPLAEVAPQVRAEMRRREGDRVLRERLDSLRRDAHVSLAPGTV
ncbi:MAG: peptidylprolyl isomerase [Myxococcota bacterium]